jgi:hypothetical protein
MTRVDGSLARSLDFSEGPAGCGRPVVPVPGGQSRLRLTRARHAINGLRSSGPAKYRALEVRRRRAQIAARHLLDLMDAQETTR